MKKISPVLIGLLQAVAMTVYVALVAGFFLLMSTVNVEPDGFAGVLGMLLLLVFSASVSGVIIFGSPVYFLVHKKASKALAIVGFTALFLLLIIIIFMMILLV